MGALIRKSNRVLERTVVWLEEKGIAGPLRVIFAATLVGVPTYQNFLLIRSPYWLIPFSLAAVLLIPLENYHYAATAKKITRKLADINGSFAGSLESLSIRMVAAPKRRLNHDHCESICTALLHRIKDYSKLALEVDGTPRLRVTLAVPIPDAAGVVHSLKVWAYDETYPDRGFTEIPLRAEGELLPGAPAAFEEGEVQIINDIRSVTAIVKAERRPYRSVVSIPLPSAGSAGRPLAVVSIDADEPNYFDAALFLEKVRPLISPVINAISLVLSIKDGGSYGFPK